MGFCGLGLMSGIIGEAAVLVGMTDSTIALLSISLPVMREPISDSLMAPWIMTGSGRWDCSRANAGMVRRIPSTDNIRIDLFWKRILVGIRIFVASERLITRQKKVQLKCYRKVIHAKITVLRPYLGEPWRFRYFLKVCALASRGESQRVLEMLLTNVIRC